MRTFKCDGCYEKCCVTIQFGSNPPRRCHHDDNISNWYEVKEETTTKRSQLPKLTVEVFKRPDCPNWANYAVINHNGRLSFFGDKPNFEGEDYGCWSCDNYKYTHIKNAFFDPSDWENSLIERPVKEELPDWCKVGKHGFDNVQKRYFEIVHIDEKWVDIEYMDDGSKETAHRSDMSKCSEAVKRPFNDKEMLDLIGKVLDWGDYREVVTHSSLGRIGVDSLYAKRTPTDLMNGCTIDGKPCYKLEHLNEKGAWVE